MIHASLTSPGKRAALTAFAAAPPQKLFDITPVVHPQHGLPSDRSRTFWSATANAFYIVRQDGGDSDGFDLLSVERIERA